MADLYYIESGYLTPDSGYYTYIADAAATPSSAFTISCDVTVTAVKQANADLTSTSTVYCDSLRIQQSNVDLVSAVTQSSTAVKTVSSVTAISSAFTQVAYGARERDIDMFAFSDAALSAQVQRIRDNNIAATSVFSIAIDYKRIRNIATADNALFTFSAIPERSRAASMATQAAFSLSTQTSVIRTVSSTITSQFGTVSIIGEIQQFGINLTSRFTTSIGTKIYAQRTILERSTIGLGGYTNVTLDSGSKFGSGSLKIMDRNSKDSQTAPSDRVTVGSYSYYFAQNKTYKLDLDGNLVATYSSNLGGDSYNVVKHNGTVFYCVTAYTNYPTSDVTIKTSTDGYTWTSYTGTQSGFNGRFSKHLTYFSGYWYIGVRYPNGIGISRSTNLTTWTSVKTDTSNSWASSGDSFEVTSVYNTGSEIGFTYYVYGAGLNPLVYSTNGTTWTNASVASSSYYLGESGYANGVYWALRYLKASPYTYTYVYSTDKTTWNTAYAADYSTAPYYVNGYWFKTFSAANQYGDRFAYSSTINGTYTDTGFAVQQNPSGVVNPKIYYANSKWQVLIGAELWTSTNLTTWTNTTNIGSYALGYLQYKNLGNDFSDFKTIDFWVYFTATSNNQSGPWISLESGNNSYLTIYASNGNISVTGTFTDTVAYINLYDTNHYGPGWYHVRIAKDSGNISLFFNGSRVRTQSIGVTGTLGTDTRLYITSQGDDISYLDDFVITDELLTSPTATTYTVPTTKYVNNSYVDVLLPFDGSTIDANLVDIIPQAGLTSVSTLTVRIGAKYDSNLGTLAAVSSLSATITDIRSISMVAFSNANLSATSTRIRQGNSSVSSASTVSAIGYAKESGNASLTAVVQQTINNTRTRDNTISTSSVAAEVIAITRIAGLLIDDRIYTNLSATGNVIRAGSVQLSSQFSITPYNYKVRYDSSSMSSNSAVSISYFIGKLGNANLNSAFTQTADVQRIRGFSSTQNTVSTLTASFSNLGRIECNLFDVATLSITPVKVARVNPALSSVSTIVANNIRTRNLVMAANSLFTETIAIKKTTGFSAALQANAGEVAAVIVRVSDVADLRSISTLTLTPKITRRTGSVINSAFTETVAIKKTTRFASAVTCRATLVVNGWFVVQARANLQGFAAEVAVIVRKANALADLHSVSTVTASISLRKGTSAPLSSRFIVVAAGTRLVKFSGAITSRFTQTALGGFKANGVIHISSAMTFVANVREIQLDDIVYIITKETWSYDIHSETREYIILGETREYIIT